MVREEDSVAMRVDMPGVVDVQDGEVEDENICPECGGSTITDFVRGERVCQLCGLVTEDFIIESGPEWRAFDSEEWAKRSRVGPPMTYAVHDKGLHTDIGYAYRDGHGNPIPSKNMDRIVKLRKWQKRTDSRILRDMLSEIYRLVSAIGLPKNVKESASIICRRVLENGLVRGRSLESIASASVYAACRQAGIPIQLREVARYSVVGMKDVGRAYKSITRKLPDLSSWPESPEQYVPRICSNLGLTGAVREKAMRLLQKPENRKVISGKVPAGVAGAAVYLALKTCSKDELKECGGMRSQKQIAEASGVTEVTIRNICKAFNIHFI